MKTMYVYILLCSDDSYYTGVTNDLEIRFEQHKQGIFANCYTYKRRPLKIAYYQFFNGPKSAIAFEKRLKGWSRAKKEALINSNWGTLKELATCNNETNFNNVNTHTSTPLSMTPTALFDAKVESETNFNNANMHTSTPLSMTPTALLDSKVESETNFNNANMHTSTPLSMTPTALLNQKVT